MSVLTIGEIYKGIEKLQDSWKKLYLEAWVKNDLIGRFRGRILPVDEEVAVTWGKLQGMAERAGWPMPTMDGLIAATAIVHKMAVVTRNVSDMAESGAMLINPWKEED